MLRICWSLAKRRQVKAFLRLNKGAIKALLRLNSGAITALFIKELQDWNSTRKGK